MKIKFWVAKTPYVIKPSESIERNLIVQHVPKHTPSIIPHVEEGTVYAIKGEVPDDCLHEQGLIVEFDAGAEHVLHEGVVTLRPGPRPTEIQKNNQV